MRKRRMEAVENVKGAYLTTERAAELTAWEAANCVKTMIEERRNANLPVATGTAELELVAEGALHAVRAHTCFARAHAGMRAIPALIGVPMAAGGDDTYPNEPGYQYFTQARKRITETA